MGEAGYKRVSKDQQRSWRSVNPPPLLAATELEQEMLFKINLKCCRQGVTWSDLQLRSSWGGAQCQGSLPSDTGAALWMVAQEVSVEAEPAPLVSKQRGELY